MATLLILILFVFIGVQSLIFASAADDILERLKRIEGERECEDTGEICQHT